MLLLGALGIGSWKHYTVAAEAMATAEQYRDFVPNVRTAPVRASGRTMSVIWPATTEAFEQANIYARASGYISKRNVDIGSRVKAGDLLVEIIAPELEHQITQAESILAQLKASLVQARANRDLAQVTWDRDNPLVQNGWGTALQGDTDRLNLQQRAAAVTDVDQLLFTQVSKPSIDCRRAVWRANGETPHHHGKIRLHWFFVYPGGVGRRH